MKNVLNLFRFRRAIRALERIAAAQESIAESARQQVPSPRPKPKPVEWGEFNVEEANARYQKEIEARAAGIDLED